MSASRLPIVLVLATASCRPFETASPQAPPKQSQQVHNLHAFARLYGVVRWFHPSDAASVIDWERFAVDGAYRVVDAPDSDVLRARLNELFADIAPTMHIARDGEPFPPIPSFSPTAMAGLDLVFWQHKGFGDTGPPIGDYASKRRHRDRVVLVPGSPFATLSQTIDATPYRGARIRFRGKLRTANRGRGRLWLRVDRGSTRGFFDNMASRPVVNDYWTNAEIIGTVAEDATQIAFGEIMTSFGTVWYDDLQLDVSPAGLSADTWKPLEIRDGNFESTDPLSNWRPGIGKPGSMGSNDGWSILIDHSAAASGTASLKIAPATKLGSEELFDDAPLPGETVDIDLGSGLRARVPIILYSKDGHTLGDNPLHARRSQSRFASPKHAEFDAIAGAADVVIVWNVLQHFWPYWGILATDWSAELDRALAHALNDRSFDGHAETLELLSAGAPDGHSFVSCPGQTRRGYPPFVVELVESKIVVVHSGGGEIEIGDEIIAINGRSARQLLAEAVARTSGSPQWQIVHALGEFARIPAGATLALRVRRGDTEIDVAVSSREGPPAFPQRAAIERLSDGVYYVNLAAATMGELDAVMSDLATAPGVVFDVRDRPNSNEQVLSHLLAGPDNANWMAIPKVIRPDHPMQTMSWELSGWQLPLLQPRITGRIAFLTGPAAISYAESVMGIVAHYRLGAIVGEPTAGTNGDIAQVMEPTGCITMFTGRRVTRLDGSRFHLIGVQPTVPAHRTLAGVLAGRDEVLEAGLSYVRGQVK